jgi:HEAT repeat protein
MAHPLVSEAILQLSGPERAPRKAAAETLGRCRDPSAVRPLLQYLQDHDEVVRASVVEALGRIGERAAVRPLCEALDKPASVRLLVVTAVALGRLGDPSALPHLCRHLDSGSPLARGACVESLGRLRDPDALPMLCGALRDFVEYVRTAAATAIGDIVEGAPAPREGNGHATTKVGSETLSNVGVLGPLLECLGDYEPPVRTAAAVSLGKLGDRLAIDPLLKRLADPAPEVRSAVASALVRMGTTAIEPTRPYLDHGRSAVREAAVGVLLTLGWRPGSPEDLVRVAIARQEWTELNRAGKVAVSLLIPYLKDANPEVRGGAARALGAIGDRAALPALRARVALWGALEPNATVRQAIAAAIRGIENQTAHLRAVPIPAHAPAEASGELPIPTDGPMPDSHRLPTPMDRP